jgi:hypothetical protein
MDDVISPNTSKTYNTMDFAPFIALRLTSIILGLTGAELTEVLGSLGHHVLEQFHLDSSELLPW